MSSRVSNVIVAMLLGVVLGLLIGGTGALAQFNTPPDSHGVMYLANHHKELNFSLIPGQSASFQLPKKDVPVKVQVFTSAVTQIVNGQPVETPFYYIEPNCFIDSPTGRVLGIHSHDSSPGGLTFDFETDNTGRVTFGTSNAQNTITPQIRFDISMWF